MKCEKVDSWFELHGEESEKPGWEELLTHARSCPDCSLFFRQRTMLLEAMRDLPEPEYPAGLHASIIQAIETFASDGPADDPTSSLPGDLSEEHRDNLLDRILVGWARPLQVGLSIACLVMVFQLATIREDRTKTAFPRLSPRKAAAVTASSAKPALPGSSGKLARLKPAEVKVFLDKLENYRRLHPEMEPQINPGPAVRMVGHGTW